MDQKLLKPIALLDIGQNLVIGDIHVDLIDTLTQEEFEAVTNFRKQIGQHFILTERKTPTDSQVWDISEIN